MTVMIHVLSVCVVVLPITWIRCWRYIPGIVRAITPCLLLAACAWDLIDGRGRGSLAACMGVGALIGLLLRYPKHAPSDANLDRLASVPVHEDVFFCAGAYGVLFKLFQTIAR